MATRWHSRRVRAACVPSWSSRGTRRARRSRPSRPPARAKRLAEILAREPAELVHPFDDERIIAGQGTAALEFLSEVPQLEVISTPIGGGGLIGGTALAAKALRRAS